MCHKEGSEMTAKAKDEYRIHLRFSRWMYNGIDVLSAKLGMTVSDVIRSAVNDLIRKELKQSEQSNLTDEDEVGYMIGEYRERGESLTPRLDIDEDEKILNEIHEIEQEIKSLDAKGYEFDFGVEWGKYWRLRQKLAREYGVIYDRYSLKNYDVGMDTDHSPEIEYLKSLAKKYKREKGKSKDKRIKIVEKDYVMYYSEDEKEQEKIDEILYELRGECHCASIELIGELGQPEEHLDKVWEYRKQLAMNHGILYNPDDDPFCDLESKDWEKNQFEKEMTELKKLANQFKERKKGEKKKKS
jgi:hypothetical protein